MGLKELLNKREYSGQERKEINKEISRGLEPVCYDVLRLFSAEHLSFEVNGMGLHDVFKRIKKVSEVVGYDKLECNLSEVFIHPQDVKRALDSLVQKKKIRYFKEGYSIEKNSSQILAELKL